MEREELTLHEMHKGILVILKKIIEICDKININYYMAYGSLIGVVRHRGFIPWDDDLDLYMMRPDYDKFLAWCMEHEQELYPFKLLSRENCENYPYNIARFNDLRYEAVYENTQAYISGMFIDIYPLDGAGNEEVKFEKKMRIIKRNLFRFILWSTDDHYEPSGKKKKWRSAVKVLGRRYAKVRGAEHFLDKMLKLGKQFTIKDSKYVSVLIWDASMYVQDKSDFEEFVYGEFEGIQVKIPKGYDRVLKNIYGNYMELPPEEERVPHHRYKLYYRD